jgi:hypothetical protein
MYLLPTRRREPPLTGSSFGEHTTELDPLPGYSAYGELFNASPEKGLEYESIASRRGSTPTCSSMETTG